MNTRTSSLLTSLVSATVLAFVAAPAQAEETSEVIHWNAFAVDTTSRAMPNDPCTESRILAIVHLAMHDAANTITPRFETFGAKSGQPENGSVDAAVAAAAYTALRECLPQNAAALEAEFSRRIEALPETGREAGVAIGSRVAARIVALRQDDGCANTITCAPGTQPGQHRPTAPDFTPALMGHWGKVRPFGLRASDQFRPEAPYAPDTPAAQRDLDQVKSVGGLNSRARTAEQSQIAQFWYEHSTRGWNRIARHLAASRGLDLWEQARLLALVNVAMADGFIAGFEAKYHYYYWRPSTALRETVDPEWLSFLPTPPVPDYPSTHTVLGAAAAAVMAQCLGTDAVPFEMTSGAPYAAITRRFASLSQAAKENGQSRIFAGLHFAHAVDAGYKQGSEVGGYVAAQMLRPVGRTNALATSP